MGANTYTRAGSTAVDISPRNATEANLGTDMTAGKIGIATDTYRGVIKHHDGQVVGIPVVKSGRLEMSDGEKIGTADNNIVFLDSVSMQVSVLGTATEKLLKAIDADGTIELGTPETDYLTPASIPQLTTAGARFMARSVTLTDDATSVLANADQGFIFVRLVNGTATGAWVLGIVAGNTWVTIAASDNFSTTDTDAKLCIFFSGVWYLKNRLGSEQTFAIFSMNSNGG